MRVISIRKISWIIILVALALGCGEEDDGDPVGGDSGTAGEGGIGAMAGEDDWGGESGSQRIAGTSGAAGTYDIVGTGGTNVNTGGTGGDNGTGDGLSGIPGSKPVVDLTEQEVVAFCQWVDSMPGSGVEQDCGGGLTVTVGSSEDCLNATSHVVSTCQVMVSQAETCFIDMLEDACTDLGFPPSCMALFACAQW